MTLSRPLALMLMSAGLLAGLSVQSAQAADAYFRFPRHPRRRRGLHRRRRPVAHGARGGTAQRLTTHPGAETNAAISHDGKWIAFTASYEGARKPM
jgi:tricorn protease